MQLKKGMNAKNLFKLIILFYFVLTVRQIWIDSSRPPQLEITFFDVGQGDAILIRTPNNKTVLVDGGPSYEIDYHLYKWKPLSRCKLDAVVLTHPHKDHVYGLLRVLDNCSVGTILHNPVNYSSSIYREWLEAVSGHTTRSATIENGSFTLDGVGFHILWPTARYVAEEQGYIDNPNDLSVVMLIDYGDNEILLTGDAETGVLSRLDKAFLAQKIDNGLDVYKVPHQGSSDALNAELIEQLGIHTAVISVGENNSYGHPHRRVIDHLESLNINVLRTDENGTIKFRFE